MKCKVCDGSGITKGYDAILGRFFDMKCFACDGSGEVDHYEEEKKEPSTNEECSMCHGTKEVLTATGKSPCPKCYLYDISHEQTNEEWFDTLSTREKAKWLDGLIAYCFGVGHITETEQKKYQYIVADVEAWLRQPRTNEETK